jgi:cell migration-inducing and hyaluronan-binding protein
MSLLVDQSTPHINMIYVEGGRVIFSDEADMTLDANYFVFVGGEFRAGLPNAPYQRKLTITLHGGYYDKQLPYFGNKVLGCLNCKFNMHGKVRTPTWTELSQTIAQGSNTVKLVDAVDWVVGEHIAVAASGYNHFESEERIITAVADAGKTLTVNKPFTYRHFSGVETYGGKDFVMRAEVGLLTRNIVIQGDNMSETYNHGSHLMFMGKVATGLDATLSYTEITQCGQPKVVGRYCSHFHMAG